MQLSYSSYKNDIKSFDSEEYSLNLENSISINFSDNKNLIAWIGRKVFKGSKNKVVFNTIYESEVADFTERDARNIGKAGSSGVKGRCYVSGYTTKTGKRVSGYYRSC